MSEATSQPRERCSYCGAALVVVHVHGHGQCQSCGTNVDPCCSGANPGSEAMQPGTNAVPVDAAHAHGLNVALRRLLLPV